MSTDNEILELAAIAAGYETDWVQCVDDTHILHVWNGDICMEWNPLTDDGDALRLAVKLRLEIYFFDGFGEVVAEHNTASFEPGREQYADDMNSATRRAIVRAAAEIGRNME